MGTRSGHGPAIPDSTVNHPEGPPKINEVTDAQEDPSAFSAGYAGAWRRRFASQVIG